MSTATVLRGEVRCARKVMLRDPMAVFVTVVLPLLYLFIFATVDLRKAGDHAHARPARHPEGPGVRGGLGDRDRRGIGGLHVPGRPTGTRPGGRDPQTASQRPGAHQHLPGRARHQRDGRLADTGGPGGCSGPPRLRRVAASRPPARRRHHRDHRRARVLRTGMPGHRGHPQGDRGHAAPVRRSPSPCSSYPATSSPPTQLPPPGAPWPTCSRSGTSSRPCSPPTTRT